MFKAIGSSQEHTEKEKSNIKSKIVPFHLKVVKSMEMEFQTEVARDWRKEI